MKRAVMRNPAAAGWILSTPALLLLTVFLITPFVMAIAFSFTNQRLIPNPNLPTAFVGFRNYLRLAADETFLRGLLNNFYFVLVVVPVQTAFALLLAMLINRRIPGVNIFRTIYFSPW